MSNVRMKIAAGATVLGLGGLGGFALGNNDATTTAAVTPTSSHDPKVRTHVIHRRIQVRPKSPTAGVSGSAAPAVAPPVPATPVVTPVSSPAPAPVEAPATPVSSPAGSNSTPPVSTHTSGAGGGASSTGGGTYESDDNVSENGDD